MSEAKVDSAAVAAVFGQAAIDKAAAAVKAACSQYGKVRGYVRDVYKALLSSGKKAEDVSVADRQAFVKAACEQSGVDYSPLSRTGIFSAVAAEFDFPVAKGKRGKADKGNVVKVNAAKADKADIVKAIKAILKIAGKRDDGKDIVEAIRAVLEK